MAAVTPLQCDVNLAQAIASGDRGAFRAVVRRYDRLLCRTARAIVHDDFDAEDVVQSSYLLAYRNIGRYRGKARLSTWLVRIVINEARACLRRRSRMKGVVSLDNESAQQPIEAAVQMTNGTGESPERAAIRSDLRALLQAKIDELPPSQRGVFTLRAVEDYSVAETAVALGVPDATVRTRFFRARGRLCAALAPYLDRPVIAAVRPRQRLRTCALAAASNAEEVGVAPGVQPSPRDPRASQASVGASAVREKP